MVVEWSDVGTICTIVGALLGVATVYLRLSIRSETGDMRDRIMAAVRAEFVRHDLNDEKMKNINGHINSLWDSVRKMERRLGHVPQRRSERDDEDTRLT